MNYAEAEALFKTARDPSAGKPLMANTRLHKSGTYYFIQLYDTVIIRFYPDDSVDIRTTHTGNLTRDRIKKYTGAWMGNVKLATYNGFLPDKQKVFCLHYKKQIVVCEGLSGFIVIDSTGQIDMNSVKAITNQVITDSTGLRKLQISANKIANHIHLRWKLLGREEGGNPTLFLLYQAGRQLEAVLADGIPARRIVSAPSLWDIAKHLGRTKILEMKTPYFV